MSVKLPALSVISGDEYLRRSRWLKGLAAQLKSEGYRVETADAEVPGDLTRAMNANNFSDDPQVVMVHNPHKGDLSLYQDWAKGKGDPDLLLVLHYEGNLPGNTKFGKWAKTVKAQKAFPKPKEWDAPVEAAEFVRQEFRARGKTVGHPDLPMTLVRRLGTDLGFLAFEVQKICLMADAEGVEVVEPQLVRGVLAPLQAESAYAVREALEGRNKKKLAQALDRVGRSAKADPTMQVIGLLEKNGVPLWFQVACLSELPPKQVAQELGVSEWLLKNKIVHVARRWGRDDLIRLIQALAESKRAVLQGHQSPWIGLSSRLLRIC